MVAAQQFTHRWFLVHSVPFAALQHHEPKDGSGIVCTLNYLVSRVLLAFTMPVADGWRVV